MNLVQATQSGFRNYVNFNGRATRGEFWWFVLAYVIASFVAGILDAAIRSPIVGVIVGLAFLLPILAIEVRRLHDSDRSGWWVFISLVPIVGTILLIVWWCARGSTGTNKYGVDPLLAAGIDASVFSPVANSSDLPR